MNDELNLHALLERGGEMRCDEMRKNSEGCLCVLYCVKNEHVSITSLSICHHMG